MAMAGSQPQRRNSPTQGAAMLALSALFFALMGGLIREASSTVNNETVVFFRNLVGVLFFLPLALTRGIGPLRTRRPLSHYRTCCAPPTAWAACTATSTPSPTCR